LSFSYTSPDIYARATCALAARRASNAALKESRGILLGIAHTEQHAERLVDLARRGVPDAGGEVARIARNHKAAAPDGAQLSPEGKPLGMIRFPERPSNCALGGKDGRTLFVTAQKGVYSIDVEGARSR
jgi:hypothetical protein